jgi:hypothetical protein
MTMHGRHYFTPRGVYSLLRPEDGADLIYKLKVQLS